MDPSLDERVRDGLFAAAEDAPVFRGLRKPSRGRRRGRGWVPAVAAATVALVAAGALFFSVARPDPIPDGEGASCAATLLFEGKKYQGHGDQLRTPRPGPSLGDGVAPGCTGGDEYSLTVSQLRGVDPTLAVLAEGKVWVEDSQLGKPLPAAIAELEEPLACELEANTTTIQGKWASYYGPNSESDRPFVPPYVAVIDATSGEGLPFKKYLAVSIDVEVTALTKGGGDSALAKRALQGGEPVEVSVVCASGQFVAESITLAG